MEWISAMNGLLCFLEKPERIDAIVLVFQSVSLLQSGVILFFLLFSVDSIRRL